MNEYYLEKIFLHCIAHGKKSICTQLWESDVVPARPIENKYNDNASYLDLF